MPSTPHAGVVGPQQACLEQCFRSLAVCSVLVWMVLWCTGCAGVKVATLSTEDYIAQRRGDVLTKGELSAAARDTLVSLAVDPKLCREHVGACEQALSERQGIDDEHRLAAQSEIWLQEALRMERRRATQPGSSDALFDAYLQTARYAYAYLFFTSREPGQRAFEDRQSQVRDYYNYAVQQAMTLLFERYRHAPQAVHGRLQVGDWQIRGDMSELRSVSGSPPREVLPASRLTFRGLRSIYRRDGFGAELVVANELAGTEDAAFEEAYSETPYQAVTAILTFPGETLQQVLQAREGTFVGYDPYKRDSVSLRGTEVPLAANFTSSYGLWLARSNFATQALRSVLGKDKGIDAPHVFLLQPFDPNRLVVVMLHGLASSPEAWINVANEVMGDAALRTRYQVWQVYYPTNMPMAYNNAEIRAALSETFRHFDPSASAAASRHIVVIGHSMGGVLSRILVSSTGSLLWDAAREQRKLNELSEQKIARIRSEFGNYFHFEPFPGVTRAVFIAAPHQGTPFAGNQLARWLSALITLPVTAVRQFTRLNQLVGDGPELQAQTLAHLPNGVDNLRDTDPFVQVSARFPISASVRYHSIIANDTPKKALADSDDGLVPYRSAHLAGAQSELVIPFSHSVQETPEAILEIRRILREHLEDGQPPHLRSSEHEHERQ